MPTISQIIASFDAQKPNSVDTNIKIDWLSELDCQVNNEIISLNEETEFKGYNADTDMDCELLIPEAFKEAYIYWLMSKVDFFNAEYTRYNNDIIMFNNKYNDYKAFYISRNRPNTDNRIIV